MSREREVRFFPADRLREFTLRVFRSLGVADSEIAAEVLSCADRRGIDSHGVARLRSYVGLLAAGRINPRPALRATRAAPGTRGPLVPGDPERAAETERARTGVPLLPAVVEELRDVSRQTGVPFD